MSRIYCFWWKVSSSFCLGGDECAFAGEVTLRYRNAEVVCGSAVLGGNGVSLSAGYEALEEDSHSTQLSDDHRLSLWRVRLLV